MLQKEIKAPVPVMDEEGYPANFGWACSSVFKYEPEHIRVSRWHISESDRYIIFSSTHIITLEIIDNGCLGYISTSLFSFNNKQKTAQVFISPFSMGRFEMPPNSDTGSIRLEQKKSIFKFITMDKGVRIIKTDIPKFGHQRRLRGEVVLFEPHGAQSIVNHAPWRGEKGAFRYSRSSPWYTVEGVMQFGTSEIPFTRGNSWGIFNWNRGVRPRSDIRYWATACGLSKGKQLSFSVGYGSEDASIGTENAFFLEGKIQKLDQVTFHISPTNWLLPWHFTSNDNRLEMTFTPHQERIEFNRMFLHALHCRQVCGLFSGKVTLDDGSVFEFNGIKGFAERRKTRF